MEVVSNSSPIIHLAKIGKLDLLKHIFNTINIPKAVYYECVIEGDARPEVEFIKCAEWIKVSTVKNKNLLKLLSTHLDKGESEAITLALEIKADLVLLDDYEARERARLFGLKVTGTLGILIKAKKLGLIKNLKEEITNLQNSGFWLKDNFIRKILKTVGEF